MARYINDNGEYYDGGSIVIGDRRYLSPSEDIILQAGYHLVVEPELTQEELLEQAKMDKIVEIDMYDQSDEVNLFYLAGQPMWLDAQTRQTLRISIESYAAMGRETATKWFGGQQFTFPINAWLTMLNALEVYAAEALNTTEAHKANVRSLTSIQEVEDYDFTTDYPEKLNLNGEWLRQLGQEQ